jgi:hypothetical protein
MARAHGIAILTLVFTGTGLWLFLGGRHDGPAPAAAERPPRPEPGSGPAEPVRAERTPGTMATAHATAPGETRPVPAPTDSLTASPTDAGPRPTVVLSVYAIDGPPPATAFRWRFRSDAETTRGIGNGRETGLVLPPGTSGELSVEADGFQPWLQDLVVPGLASEPKRVEVGLQRIASHSGVTLTFTDLAGAPVGRLRVEVWPLASAAADPAPGTDPAGNPLWSRTSEQPDGVYRLPDLPPGRYSLLATAVLADGMPQPLLSFRSVFQFTGSEAIPLATARPEAVVVRYTLAAASGAARQLRVRTRDATGAERRVLWRSKTAAGVVLATDEITAPGVAAPHEALPAEAWTIEVSFGDTLLAVTRLSAPGLVEQTIDLP